MRVKVTQAHINQGERTKTQKCPIALALKDALGKDVVVGVVTWNTLGTWKQEELPPLARHFIRMFDAGERVGPFEFVIDD